MESNCSWDLDFVQEDLQIRSDYPPLKSEPEIMKSTTPSLDSSKRIFQCKDCMFLTISEMRYEEHNRVGHPVGQSQNPTLIICPGCPNSSFDRHSLQVHLITEHKVDPLEIPDILELSQSRPSTTVPTKSRIFIKSVDVLRNPSFVEENSTPDHFTAPITLDSSSVNALIDLCDVAEEISSTGQQRQKIYLKNVNELQEQQNNLLTPDFDPDFQPMPTFQPQLSFVIPDTVPTTGDDSLRLPSINYYARGADGIAEEHPSAAPKNKIYIRNVQTLIRPDVQLGQHSPASTTYLHLRSLDDINLMNMEEVQGLPPQRNDIVVLDDFHEEPLPAPQPPPQFYEAPSHQLHQQQFQQVSSSPSTLLEENCVDLVNKQLKVIPESPNFGLPPANEHSNFMGMFRADDSCDFYYKSQTDNIISELILSTDGQDVPPEQCRIETPDSDSILALDCIAVDDEMNGTPSLPLIGTKNDDEQDLNTPPRIDEETVICLPDESDNDDQQQRTTPLPQMPRIYVSNNLTESPNVVVPSVEVQQIRPSGSTDLAKKSRGRPRGSRNYIKCGGSFPFECPEIGCPRRFCEQSTLEYHQRCHDPITKEMVCPECETREITKWSALHTHLWRLHSIDMELYACPQCNFKTPCLSSLNNIHLKTHSEEKNYKCDTCASAFKNQKQLKNHRRHHRLSLKKAEEQETFIQCASCNVQVESAALMKKHNSECHRKVLGRSKVIPKKEKGVNRVELTQESASKEQPHGKLIRCEICPYETAHRNSYRRHLMGHSGQRKYKCEFCEYDCIQSNSFRVRSNRIFIVYPVLMTLLLSVSHFEGPP